MVVEIILYGVFGFAAFFVNVAGFSLFASVLHFHYLLSNVLAWIMATAFAFFTNRMIVFRSHGAMARESVMFLAARLLTLAVDMFLMWLFISCMGMDEVAAKIVVNVVVIVTNYVASHSRPKCLSERKSRLKPLKV